MERVRKIIQEELIKALLEMYEPVAQASGEDKILYNFEAGRAFGVNKLARDINGLSEYYMNDYFPRSEMEEGWMFEIETSYGGSQLIDITHRLDSNYRSLWELRIAEIERGSNEPQIVAETGFVEEYQTFVEKVNETLEKRINPNLL